MLVPRAAFRGSLPWSRRRRTEQPAAWVDVLRPQACGVVIMGVAARFLSQLGEPFEWVDFTLSNEVLTVQGERLTIGRGGVVRSAAESFEPADEDQIQLCIRWLSQAEATASPTLNSHWLMQVIENWAGTRISNGALILAAHRSGFPVGRERDNQTANVTIGVSPQCINEFDCGCGHP